MKTPAKLNAPISKTSLGRLKLALQQQRLKCQQLQEELQRMRTELSTNAVPVDNELNNDLLTILDNNESEMTPFMKLFWKEQRKMLSGSRTGVRYHPMIIRYCLSVHSKSDRLIKCLPGMEKFIWKERKGVFKIAISQTPSRL